MQNDSSVVVSDYAVNADIVFCTIMELNITAYTDIDSAVYKYDILTQFNFMPIWYTAYILIIMLCTCEIIRLNMVLS